MSMASVMKMKGDPRATKLHKLNKEELKDMPTNNTCAEEILLNSVILQFLQSL